MCHCTATKGLWIGILSGVIVGVIPIIVVAIYLSDSIPIAVFLFMWTPILIMFVGCMAICGQACGEHFQQQHPEPLLNSQDVIVVVHPRT
jgi:hypothetical protein